MWNVNGIKIETATGRQKIHQSKTEIHGNLNCLIFRTIPENFQSDISLGWGRGGYPRNRYTLSILNMCIRDLTGIFDRVFLPEVGRCC